MNVEEVVQSFQIPPPRSIRLKQDSEGPGVYYDPLKGCKEFAGCGSKVILLLLLIALIPYFRDGALLGATFATVVLGGFGLLIYVPALLEAHGHKYLAQHGEISVGHITEYSKVLLEDATATTILYEFPTQLGKVVSGKRESTWCYRDLEQETAILIVYHPDCPEKHEPYDSLRYCVRNEANT